MIRIALALMLTFVYSNMVLAECKMNKDIIGAKYKITTSKADKKTKHSSHIVLWRNSNQVAHEYPESHITELWEQTRNGKLRLVRYFDEHARGIEYQPDEIKNIKTKHAWQIKQQLVSQDMINAMQLESTQGKDCNKLEAYFLKTKNKTITLQWLANKNLVKSYREESPLKTITWDLQQTITERERVNNTFTSRSDYQTTDYADIGDNESDPFLMKMIHLGFVEHGATGVYDSQGQQIGKHHH